MAAHKLHNLVRLVCGQIATRVDALPVAYHDLTDFDSVISKKIRHRCLIKGLERYSVPGIAAGHKAANVRYIRSIRPPLFCFRNPRFFSVY
jgi:hypothetical protein